MKLDLNEYIYGTNSISVYVSLKLCVLLVPFITGKLTVIVGKSGSGKSSLLAAILKEMRLVSGELIWNK